MQDDNKKRHIVRPGALPPDDDYAFTLTPDAEARAAIARDLAIPGLRKLRFEGLLKPEGREDWRLEAKLGATVVQDCVVTLQPVVSRIDTTLTRRYLADAPDIPEGEEIEMPEDDTIEPLPRTLDLNAVMTEALALALPEYPHAEGVDPVDISVTAPGVTPLTEEEARPFAALAGLRDKLAGKDDE